jgi:hypothetical protein
MDICFISGLSARADRETGSTACAYLVYRFSGPCEALVLCGYGALVRRDEHSHLSPSDVKAMGWLSGRLRTVFGWPHPIPPSRRTCNGRSDPTRCRRGLLSLLPAGASHPCATHSGFQWHNPVNSGMEAPTRTVLRGNGFRSSRAQPRAKMGDLRQNFQTDNASSILVARSTQNHCP